MSRSPIPEEVVTETGSSARWLGRTTHSAAVTSSLVLVVDGWPLFATSKPISVSSLEPRAHSVERNLLAGSAGGGQLVGVEQQASRGRAGSLFDSW